MKSSKEWSNVVESRFLEDEAGGAVLDKLKAVGRTGRKTREERVAVVKSGENEGGNEFDYTCLDYSPLPSPSPPPSPITPSRT